MAKNFSFLLSVFLALGAFIGLLICPAASSGGAKAGLLLCSGVIIPSLFPLAAMGNMLLNLGIPYKLGKVFSPITKKLFGVSGAGSAAFFLGLAGGYPLGAISISEMYASGILKKGEAERLLSFCNNSGPAFIVSVAGSAVFGSAEIGFYLYAVHILSAVLCGMLLKRGNNQDSRGNLSFSPIGFSAAFTESIKRATASMVTVCGFVVFFSVLVGVLDASGVLLSLSGGISSYSGTELHFSRSLLTGILEIGTGISSMLGLSANAQNAALCSFLIGWGGLSVHAQAAAVIREGGLNPARHTFGKLLHGCLSALITFFTYPIIF